MGHPACRMLHFGEPPRWSQGVRFILVDSEPSACDAVKAASVLAGESLMLGGQETGTLWCCLAVSLVPSCASACVLGVGVAEGLWCSVCGS